ncbi:hypothetical protein E1B28_000036 [Marasmius oreades]|uniref:Uncharacterized protein n=1 Tax=Marasmius oreades TaxID=181124 RepID=A0A9P7V0M1_9AGAR|nr:uncharacterized protein E1B28_000036 [Marasmius oreades]KAG7098062.1 hypothetical protein E1B28_000036 [Marasmius oreades]
MFPSLSLENCNGFNSQQQQFQLQLNSLLLFQSARSEQQFNQAHYSQETAQESINICSTGQLHALISAITEGQLRSAGNPVFLKPEQKVQHLEHTVQLHGFFKPSTNSNASELVPTPEEPQSTSPPSQNVVDADNTCRLEPATSKPKRGSMRGGLARGSWKIPSVISPKWEAAADWKLVNPTETLKEYKMVWSNVISKDWVQLPMYQKCASVCHEATEKK